jgi:hypothetical protein
MGPPTYTLSVVDRNVVMRRMTVEGAFVDSNSMQGELAT